MTAAVDAPRAASRKASRKASRTSAGGPARKGPGPRSEAWSRRLPLLPALVFLIVLT